MSYPSQGMVSAGGGYREVAMTLRQHKIWKDLKPHIKVEKYFREGGTINPRFRIEIRPSIPGPLLERATKVRVGCVSCGEEIFPIRIRNSQQGRGGGHAYYACSCPLTVSIGCSRGEAAKQEYKAMYLAVQPREKL